MTLDLMPISAMALRRFMIETGIHTQKELVARTNIPQGAMSRILRGEQKRVVRKKIEVLSKVLNVPPESLQKDPDNLDMPNVAAAKPTNPQRSTSKRKPVKKKGVQVRYLAPAIVADERLRDVFPSIRQYAQSIALEHDPPIEKIEARMRPSRNGKGLGVVVMRWATEKGLVEKEFFIQRLERTGLVPADPVFTE